MDLTMGLDQATALQRKRAADSHADGIDKRIRHNNNAHTSVAPHRDLGFNPWRDPPPVDEQYASEHARLGCLCQRIGDMPPHHPHKLQSHIYARLPLQSPNSNHKAMVPPAPQTQVAPSHTPSVYRPATTRVPAGRGSGGPFLGVINGSGPVDRMNPGGGINPALSTSTVPVGYQQSRPFGERQPLPQNAAQRQPGLRANPPRRQGFYQQQAPQGYTAQQPQQTKQLKPDDVWGVIAQKQLQLPVDHVPGIPLNWKMPQPAERPLLLPYQVLLARHLRPRERYNRYRQYHAVLATHWKTPLDLMKFAQAMSRKLQEDEYKAHWQWHQEKSGKQRAQECTRNYLLKDLQLGPGAIPVALDHFQPNSSKNRDIINAAREQVSAWPLGAPNNAAEPVPVSRQPPQVKGPQVKGTKDTPIILDDDEGEPVKTTTINRPDGMNPATKRGAPTAASATLKSPRTDAYSKPADIIVIPDEVNQEDSSPSVSDLVRAPVSASDPTSASVPGQASVLASTTGPAPIPDPVRSPNFFSVSGSTPRPDSGSTPLATGTPHTDSSIDVDPLSTSTSTPKPPSGPAKVLDGQNFQDWTAKWKREKAIVDSTLPGNLSKELLAAANSGRFKFRTAWEAYVAAEEAQRNAGKIQQQAAARVQARKDIRRAANKTYKDKIRQLKAAGKTQEKEDGERAPEAVEQVSQQGAAPKVHRQNQQQGQQQEAQNEGTRYVNEDLVEDALSLLANEAEEGSPAPSLVGEQQTVEENQNDLLQDALAFLEEEEEDPIASNDESSGARRAGEGTVVEHPSVAVESIQEDSQPRSPEDVSPGLVVNRSLVDDDDQDLDSLFEDDEELVASSPTPAEKAQATESHISAANNAQDLDSLFVGDDSDPTVSPTKAVETSEDIEEEPVVFLASGLADDTEDNYDDLFENDEEEAAVSSMARSEKAQAAEGDSSITVDSGLSEDTDDDYDYLFEEEDDEAVDTPPTSPISPQEINAKDAAVGLGSASPSPAGISIDIQSQTAEQDDAEPISSDESDESDESDADDPDSESEEDNEPDSALEEGRIIAGMYTQIANWQKQIETTRNQPYKLRLQGLIAEKHEQLRKFHGRG